MSLVFLFFFSFRVVLSALMELIDPRDTVGSETENAVRSLRNPSCILFCENVNWFQRFCFPNGVEKLPSTVLTFQLVLFCWSVLEHSTTRNIPLLWQVSV